MREGGREGGREDVPTARPELAHVIVSDTGQNVA